MPDTSKPDGHGAPSLNELERVPFDAPQLQVAARNPRRAEKIVALCFVASFFGFGGFGAAYWYVAGTFWYGVTLGVGFAGFGFGLAAWGKYLMPRGPFVEARPQMATTREEKERFVGDFASRGKVAIARRRFLAKAMGLAGGVLGIITLFPLIRSLGPLPGLSQYRTKWKKGSFLTTIDGKKVTVDDVAVGGVLTVFPPDDIGGALSQTVLLHVQESGNVVTMKGRETWGPQGFVAFSKVCTHAGCPVGLYEELTQQLLCPCHQSLFDIYSGCVPVFGPAPRPLPQLALYIDQDGYIRAQHGYIEPIGPGFWSRGAAPFKRYRGKA
jgi:ubiquinol-cytochrome c reductase iron-sulfur subunit